MLVEFDGIWWAGEKGGLGKTGEKKKGGAGSSFRILTWKGKKKIKYYAPGGSDVFLSSGG